MPKTITINPVTRVEGHGKITLELDEQDRVSNARFSVQEFRGFEKFCQGALAERLPSLTARICGICPISHHIASVKTVEACFGVKISPTSEKIRELMMLGQLIESHMLSIAALSLPDLMLGSAKPKDRNIIGIYNSGKDAVKKALEIRSFGTAICYIAGRRPGHPIGARVGGVVSLINEEEKNDLLSRYREIEPHLGWFSELMRSLCEKNADAIDTLGDIKSSYLGLSNSGSLSFYEGDVKVLNEDGSEALSFKPEKYYDNVEEKHENWSYMKFPVLKSGSGFRVGPLARVNIAQKIPTPKASEELDWFKARWGSPVHKTLTYHYARFIETLYAIERARKLLEDQDILKGEIYTKTKIKAGKGIGIVEAPRGTLVHSYELDSDGKAVKVNLTVATQHNNLGFNDALKETASKLVTNASPDEASLNKLEMIVRAYDPCLSCSTHSFGPQSFAIELLDSERNLIREYR
ncbi:Ni/Fe hydrogenase subunit alpha [bacterium]|nr:Ni/Fe hydrogenase subunit alpha [bacterium]